jgi:hypothetical protein
MSARVARRSVIYEAYRALLFKGLSPHEASAALAQTAGLVPTIDVDAPEPAPEITWRWQEVSRLLFLRWMVESGRIN